MYLKVLNEVIKCKNIDKNEETIKKIQDIKLKKIISHVLTNSIFYKELYKQYGITLNNINSINLEDLPIVDKKIIMSNFDKVICNKNINLRDLEKFINNKNNIGKTYMDYHIIHSSGTSGNKGIFVYSENDWSTLLALGITRICKLGIKKERMLFFGATDGNYAGITFTKSSPKFFLDFLPLSINDDFYNINKKSNKFNPTILAGYSSGIVMLAEEQLSGNLNIHPNKIICSAELLTSKMAKTIENAFGIKPISLYAASESISMGLQCECNSFHLFTDYHFFELVDENLNQVNEGKTGKLVLTNLYNYTLPLIRYKMNDEFSLEKSKCSCGSSFPVIKDMIGRQEEFLWFEKNNGKKEYLHPSTIVEFFIPGLEQIQAVEIEKNKFLLNVSLKGDKNNLVNEINRKMRLILEEKKVQDIVSFKINVVDKINNDIKTGKYKHVIPLT